MYPLPRLRFTYHALTNERLMKFDAPINQCGRVSETITIDIREQCNRADFTNVVIKDSTRMEINVLARISGTMHRPNELLFNAFYTLLMYMIV